MADRVTCIGPGGPITLTFATADSELRLWIPGYGRLTLDDRAVILVMSALGAHLHATAPQPRRPRPRP